ncbi:MAG: DUF934 domain-containing protein [Pseudomonadota bacterium]
MLLELTAETLEASEASVPTLAVACDVDPDEVPRNVEALAIEFPAFNDGRGLSLAVLLRRRGFDGRLVAVGETHPELYHYLYRCGFCAVEATSNYDLTAARAAYRPHLLHYQADARGTLPVYRR